VAFKEVEDLLTVYFEDVVGSGKSEGSVEDDEARRRRIWASIPLAAKISSRLQCHRDINLLNCNL